MAFGGVAAAERLEKQVEETGPTLQQWEDHIENEKINFYCFIGNRLFGLGRSFDLQMLFRNVVAEAKGLSKEGRIIFSKLGYFISDTTYRRRTAEYLDQQAQRLR